MRKRKASTEIADVIKKEVHYNKDIMLRLSNHCNTSLFPMVGIPVLKFNPSFSLFLYDHCKITQEAQYIKVTLQYYGHDRIISISL